MWCPAPVAIDINGRWTHLVLERGEEECPGRRTNQELQVGKPIGWKTRLWPGLRESVDEAVSVLEARGRVYDGRRDGRRGMGLESGAGEERLVSS